MKHVLKIAFQMSVLACLLTLASAYASSQDSSAQQPAPDNTKVNQRDKNKAEPTADQQKENQPDREIARKIRQSIVQDKSLSSYAHNVKIISINGAVTLKGPVGQTRKKLQLKPRQLKLLEPTK